MAYSINNEEVLDFELEDMYAEFLDEVYEVANIAGQEYSPSYALKQVDPIAFRVGFSDWLSFQIEDGNITEF